MYLEIRETGDRRWQANQLDGEDRVGSMSIEIDGYFEEIDTSVLIDYLPMSGLICIL